MQWIACWLFYWNAPFPPNPFYLSALNLPVFFRFLDMTGGWFHRKSSFLLQTLKWGLAGYGSGGGSGGGGGGGGPSPPFPSSRSERFFSATLASSARRKNRRKTTKTFLVGGGVPPSMLLLFHQPAAQKYIHGITSTKSHKKNKLQAKS